MKMHLFNVLMVTVIFGNMYAGQGMQRRGTVAELRRELCIEGSLNLVAGAVQCISPALYDNTMPAAATLRFLGVAKLLGVSLRGANFNFCRQDADFYRLNRASLAEAQRGGRVVQFAANYVLPLAVGVCSYAALVNNLGNPEAEQAAKEVMQACAISLAGSVATDVVAAGINLFEENRQQS